MASFFWLLTIFSLALLSSLVSNYENLDEIPQIVTIVSSSLAIYIQVCLVCFPILIFFRNLTESNLK
jgi:TRAP-type C4-dicarboxylate transport system permease small subunit